MTSTLLHLLRRGELHVRCPEPWLTARPIVTPLIGLFQKVCFPLRCMCEKVAGPDIKTDGLASAKLIELSCMHIATAYVSF